MEFIRQLKSLLYIIFVAISCLAGFYYALLNLEEVIQRSSGQDTLLSQMSWLSDQQAIFYCGISVSLFILLFVSLGWAFYKKNSSLLPAYQYYAYV